MKVIRTALPGVVVIEPRVFADARGYFLETFHEDRYLENDVFGRFVQDNHSHSVKNVLRGMHFQRKFPQGKLVQVVSGEIFDVAVDIRHGSPTFGTWVGYILNEETHRQMYIPAGFAHGFVVLSERAHVWYKCTDYYHPEEETGICWNDPQVNIKWPVKEPLLSGKDERLPLLKDVETTALQPYKVLKEKNCEA